MAADGASAQTEADAYRTVWKSLKRGERGALASEAARGLRGRNQRDAALMLWWAGGELRRGPWPSVAVAGGFGLAIVILQMVLGDASLPEALRGLGSSIIPFLVLIPLAGWVFRRPKLQRSMAQNAALLSGHKFEGPPDPEEAERILARAKREGWLRGTRPSDA